MTPAESDAIAALQSRGRFGINLGLGRTRALLAALGSPELGLRGALIGGTNGKGSTQAMVANILTTSGLRVAQTPKPHLVSYRERIVVAGQPIAAEDFAPLVQEVLLAADRVTPRHGPPTEFEALTCAALLWFARCEVDVCIVEVGMGGRLDATNAWDGGVAAITNVAFDHMEYLGTTIRAIAREKAAIIKRGDRAVTGADEEALAVIRRRASRMGVPLGVTPPLQVRGMDRSGLALGHPELGPLRLGLLGHHQAANAAVALGTVEALRAAGIADPAGAAIREGLATTRWPGRLELLTVQGQELLLDGAHNVAGATALALAVDDLEAVLAPGPATLLLGMLRDKEVAAMVAALRRSPRLAAAHVVATDVPDSPRTLAAADLAAAWGPGAVAVPDTDVALDQAIAAAGSTGGPVVVCGSLYLVGHVRGRLVGGPA